MEEDPVNIGVNIGDVMEKESYGARLLVAESSDKR